MTVKSKFSARKELDRSLIVLNPSTFQGREGAFAVASVNKIVREGYDKTQKKVSPVKKSKMAKRKISAKLVRINKLATAIQEAGGRKANKTVKGSYKIARTTAISRATKEIGRKDELVARRKRLKLRKEKAKKSTSKTRLSRHKRTTRRSK